jgi:hypothetical protein
MVGFRTILRCSESLYKQNTPEINQHCGWVVLTHLIYGYNIKKTIWGICCATPMYAG